MKYDKIKKTHNNVLTEFKVYEETGGLNVKNLPSYFEVRSKIILK